MTAEQAADRLDRLAQDLPDAVGKGLTDCLKRYRVRAVWWSSGGFSTATLRAMGHPYARAERGQQRLEPARINIQHRDLVTGWAVSEVERRGGNLSASLYNTAPHARFMAGTAAMVERPLPAKVLAEIEQAGAVEEALERAISEVMR